MVVYSHNMSIFATISAGLVFVFGIIGNLLTVIALLKYQKLRKHPTTVFVLSLAVSDLFFCAVNMPLTAIRFLNQQWTLGEGLCKVFPVFFYGNVAVSVLSMVGLTINRYTLILHPSRYSKIYTPISLFFQLLLIWGFSFGIMLLPLFEVWGRLGLDEETFSCTILKKNDSSPKKFIFLFGVLVPCIVISVSYSCIFYTVHKQRSKLKAHNANASGRIESFFRNKEDCRLTLTLLTIYLCFLICFLPLMLANVIDDDGSHANLHVFASVLAWMSAVINPFIYAIGSQNYRHAYTKLLSEMCFWKTNVELRSFDEINKSRTIDHL
ncbi:protein trapped in endoderm-1 [Sabethes cyaneus]|uniref:protein trapped in endoderm-1 n=1 Tax=Sabethes cyaneus TaxID=53552 RepID=UPI00221E2E32|nr:protein trapped in endoderm-1 [Sabethes cyaneus]